MIESSILEQCKTDNEILELKIRNLEYAIKQSEQMIAESKLDDSSLKFLRRKIVDSIQDLEVLYMIKD